MTDIWIPVAPGITTLPPAPTPTTNASPLPVNAATLPGDWDPADPDLPYLFNTILATPSPAVYPLVMTPGSVFPPYNETVVTLAKTRTTLSVLPRSYAVTLPTTTATLATRTRLIYLDPALIYVPTITYSQSSTLSANEPADNAGMTNGIFAETAQTGTDNDTFSWIQMDLGGPKTVATVYVGCDFTTVLPGDWGPSYTEDCDVEESLDGSSWSLLFNTGSFISGIQTYTVATTARYIRIVGSGYLCVTEFYATST